MSLLKSIAVFLAVLTPFHAQARSKRHDHTAVPTGIHTLVSQIAQEEGVPNALAHGVIRVESGYRCDARNRSGATGIGQVMPRTAAGVGVFGNLLDCKTGLRASMRYLHLAYVAARGDLCVAASQYERGVGGTNACTSYGRRAMYGYP